MSKAHLTLLDQLAEKYPAAFPRDPRAVKPLKVGIHQDLRAALPEVSHGVLRKALSHHSRRLAYLRALIRGGDRVDLQGQPVEPVTPEQQALAAEKLKEAQAHLQAKKAAPAPAESPKAERKKETEQSQMQPEPTVGRARPVLSLKRKPA